MKSHSEETKKLINTKSGFVVVSFNEGQPKFYDHILEEELQDRGIFVPPFLREEFKGKKSVFPKDPLFEKAFIEIYYPLVIANPIYQWETIK